jgi:unspecific peroxygenase
VSLTRNDYYLDPARNNFRLNSTLFTLFTETANRTSEGLFDRETMIRYQALRYRQSLADNGQFFYGLNSLLFCTRDFLML